MQDDRKDSQFLEIAVCDVMTTPVRHRIELQTVRELHVELLVQAGPLLVLPRSASSLACAAVDVDVLAALCEVDKFVFVKIVAVQRRRRDVPSFLQFRGGRRLQGVEYPAAGFSSRRWTARELRLWRTSGRDVAHESE